MTLQVLVLSSKKRQLSYPCPPSTRRPLAPDLAGDREAEVERPGGLLPPRTPVCTAGTRARDGMVHPLSCRVPPAPTQDNIRQKLIQTQTKPYNNHTITVQTPFKPHIQTPYKPHTNPIQTAQNVKTRYKNPRTQGRRRCHPPPHDINCCFFKTFRSQWQPGLPILECNADATELRPCMNGKILNMIQMI
jgi:hypothetical protein